MTAIPFPLTPEMLAEADQWLASAKEHQHSGDYQKAAIDIERAYRLAPQAPRVWHAGAVLRMRMKDYKWALETLGMVHQAIPNAADPCYHAGICCMSLGDYQQAKTWLKRATSRYGKKHGAGAWQVLASVYAMLGEESASRNAYQRCVECDTETADDRFNQGLVHLLRGEWEKGFELYESRLELPGFQPHTKTQLPRWNGERGWVCVIPEQGQGDTIMIERYLDRVTLLSGQRPVVAVQQPLVSWFRDRNHAAFPTGYAILSAADFQIPMMSLPGIFGVVPPSAVTSTCTTPARGIRGVNSPRDPLSSLNSELTTSAVVAKTSHVHTPRVGICWAGNKDHPNDKDRSMPADGAGWLALALDKLGCEVKNLTVGHGLPNGRTSAYCLPNTVFRPESFLATAELMETLDAVVSVDTAVLHLAATLGVPSIGLVPTAPEWRWRESGDTTDWYPSMQIVRRRRSDAWPAAIKEAAERLREIL